MSEQRAWLLNLDAEVELASPAPYTRRRAVERLVEERLAHCALLCQGEPTVGAEPVDSGCRVYCWCPTPSALAKLDAWELRAVSGPSLEVLRAVNHRAWPLGLGPAFPGREFLEPGSSWRSALASAHGDAWRFKRPYGFAGRGQRSLRGQPRTDDVRWLDDSMKKGGLVMEPLVEPVREFSIHGFVDARGLLVGTPLGFDTDAHGAPESFALAEADDVRDRALVGAAEVVATALRSAGYFGPFGLDAFEYRLGGDLHLNALSEVNARFTLGWSLGMGSERDAALGRYARER